MKIFAWHAPHGNVGDDLNHWLWPRVFEAGKAAPADATFIGIGSILDTRFDAVPGTKIVFGAGARGRDRLPDISGPDWKVVFVRGPVTAEVLGLTAERWISDPAILTPRFLGSARQNTSAERRKIGFIPYFGTDGLYAQLIARIAGFEYISPQLTVERFVECILGCDAVFCEAMHGAILSDAYGVPWAPCWISNHRAEGATTTWFKWRDWAQSLDLVISPIILPNWGARQLGLHDTTTLLLRARKAAGHLRSAMRSSNVWQLSSRELLRERQDRILEAARELQRSF